MDNPTNPHQAPVNSVEKRESVPALEVPLSNTQCHEDELLSWLQYPLEDSFDRNYCLEELYQEEERSRCDVHNAFSNLSLREATRTWGVHDTKKGGKILSADVAMAMGAQRAAGLLSQSGVDTFNRVRTNARPHVYRSAHSQITEETSGSSFNICRNQNSGTFQPVTRPNFCLFSRAGGVAETRAEEAAYDKTESIQETKRSFMRHSGGACSAPCYSQMARVATCSSSTSEQPKIASDTPMTSKELSSMRVRQPMASAGPHMGFSRLLAHHNVKEGTSNEFLKETHITASTKFTPPPFVSSKLEAEAVCFTPHNPATLRVLTTQQKRRGLLTLSASAPPSVALGASAGLSGKRIRVEGETKHLFSQEDPSIATASTVITDVDSCRQAKLARRGSLPLEDAVSAEVFSGRLHLDSKGLDAHLSRTVSEISTLDSQPHVLFKRGDTSVASPTALSGHDGKSFKEAVVYRTKRKAPPFEDSEF